jgi:hypothetical protein
MPWQCHSLVMMHTQHSANTHTHTHKRPRARTCEVHPAALHRARARHLDEQRARLVVCLAHVGRREIVPQRSVVQAELRVACGHVVVWLR